MHLLPAGPVCRVVRRRFFPEPCLAQSLAGGVWCPKAMGRPSWHAPKVGIMRRMHARMHGRGRRHACVVRSAGRTWEAAPVAAQAAGEVARAAAPGCGPPCCPAVGIWPGPFRDRRARSPAPAHRAAPARRRCGPGQSGRARCGPCRARSPASAPCCGCGCAAAPRGGRGCGSCSGCGATAWWELCAARRAFALPVLPPVRFAPQRQLRCQRPQHMPFPVPTALASRQHPLLPQIDAPSAPPARPAPAGDIRPSRPTRCPPPPYCPRTAHHAPTALAVGAVTTVQTAPSISHPPFSHITVTA